MNIVNFTPVSALIGGMIIGFSVFLLSFLYLPFFLYHRYRGKDLSKYTFDYKKLRNSGELEREMDKIKTKNKKDE